MSEVKKPKKGRLSQAEKDHIERFQKKKSVTEIAAQLQRAPSQVGAYIATLREEHPSEVFISGPVLESRPEWSRFKKQFDEEELKYLKYRYDQLMNQFGRDDVLPTEEMQIFGLIEVEIMASQAMTERQILVAQQKLVQRDWNLLIDESETPNKTAGQKKQLRAEAQACEAEFNKYSSALKGIAARHDGYRSQINTLLSNLKGTRDQRVKVIEGNRASFLGHLKALQLEDFRRDVGDDMEVMKIAMEKERLRMAAPHRYVDGSVDQPLLTSETVLESYDTPGEAG